MRFRIPSWTLAFFACLLWSTAFVGVKYALQFAQPLFIAGVRFTLAGLILIPFAGRGYLKELKEHWKIVLLVSLLQTFIMYWLYFMALDRIKASTGSSLVGLGPMMGAVLGHFFVHNENFTGKKILSFALGIIGVTLVSLAGGKGGSLPGSSEILGIFLFITNSFCGALSNIVVLRYKSSVRPAVLTSAQLAIGGFGLFIVSLFIYDDITFIFPPHFYIALAWLIFVSSCGFSIWYYLLASRKESLISMNIWKFVMPVTGGILSWIIMPDDSPTIKAILGIIIVAFSIFIYYYTPKSFRT